MDKIESDEFQKNFNHFINNIFLLQHSRDPKNKALLRVIGRNQKGRFEFDLFRVYPELEDLRYGARSEHNALTVRQFSKKFKAYSFLCLDYGEDEDWEEFLDSAHHIYRYQKLL